MEIFKIDRIGVFCGSNAGNDPLYHTTSKDLVDAMRANNIDLVYGGARAGLMGLIADHMLEIGGKVIGVIPKSMVDVEIAHEGLTELHIVNSMHERKALMADLSDGFIMLPGGPGSLDEFFEMYTWAQLGFHQKPCGILNIGNYYDYLLKFLDHVVLHQFMKPVHRNMIIVEQSPMGLIKKFARYKPPQEKKWVDSN